MVFISLNLDQTNYACIKGNLAGQGTEEDQEFTVVRCYVQCANVVG